MASWGLCTFSGDSGHKLVGMGKEVKAVTPTQLFSQRNAPEQAFSVEKYCLKENSVPLKDGKADFIPGLSQ